MKIRALIACFLPLASSLFLAAACDDDSTDDGSVDGGSSSSGAAASSSGATASSSSSSGAATSSSSSSGAATSSSSGTVSDAGGPNAGGTIRGTIQDGQAAAGKVMLVFTNDEGEGSFLYKFGEGIVTAEGTWEIVIGDIPGDAIYPSTLGVAAVYGVPADYTLPDGRIAAPDGLTDVATGQAPIYVVSIGAQVGGSDAPPWASQFAPGLHGGVCTAGAGSDGFDGFVSAPLSDIQVNTEQPSSAKCNWN